MGLRITHLVLPAYVLATIVFTWPLARHFAAAIPSGRIHVDPCMQAFILGWDWHALLARPQDVFSPPIFFPERNALTYMDHLLGEALTAAPFLAFFRSIPAAYNFLFLFSFVFSAWAVYRLTRLLGVSRLGALLAGFLFAFGPYRFANLGLLNQLQTEFLPLGILFALKYLGKYRVRDLIATAACLVVQVYFGWYYAFYLAIALGLLVMVMLLRGSFKFHRVPLWGSAAIAAVSLLLILPVTLPYVRGHAALPEFHRTLGESALYSADLLDYLKLNQNAVLASWIPLATGAQSYWPGLVTVLLGALGARGVWRRGDLAGDGRGYFLALTVSSFILSLGPILHVAGARIWIPLPYAALYYVFPGFPSMRAPARLASLVLLGLAVLAGFGYDRLRQEIRGRFPWRPLGLSLFAVSIAFAWPRPLSVVELPSGNPMPEVYAWLASQPQPEPVLELPVPARDADENETHALRQFYVLYHRHPRLDGVSGFVTRRYKEFRFAIQGFPSEEALRAAREKGAKLIIVHFGDYPPAEREWIRSRIPRRLTPIAEFGTDAVYRLAPITPEAPPGPRTSSARSPATRRSASPRGS